MLFSKKPKILAIIAARGGSKGLPNKNMYPVGNPAVPLIEFTMQAAAESEYITDTVVCSDAEHILNFTTDFGTRNYFAYSIVPLQRPANLAKDDTPMDDVVMFCIQHLMQKGFNYDFILLLQPTSPLRTGKDIDAAMALYFATPATSLISVYIPGQSPLKTFLKDKDGYLTGIVNNEYPFMNRQQLPKTYVPNGAIYFCHTNYFLANKTFFSEKTMPFVMPEQQSVDIDTYEDIKIVENIINKTKN